MALSSNSSNEDKYLFSTLTIIVLFLVVMSLLGFTLFSINYAFAQPGDNSPPAGIVEINGNQPSTSSNIVTLTLVCNDGANGVGCSGITLSWDNIDANQSPQSVDQIPNILVTSDSDENAENLSAIETGPNTGIFFLDIPKRDPIEPGDTGVYWNEGERLTVQNVRLSSQSGIKTVFAGFQDYFENGSNASDSIFLGNGDGGDCSIDSSDNLDFSVNNVSLRTLPGVTASATLMLEAASDNSDAVSTRIFIGRSDSSPNYSISENDFFVFPGQTKNVNVFFSVPANFALGDYSYRLAISARDVDGCNVPVSPIDVDLSVLTIPDFSLASTTSSLDIARGDLATSTITVNTKEKSFAPIFMDFQTGWNYQEPRLEPIETNVAFNSNRTVLEPGDNISREISFEPATVDDVTLVNYTGDFTYTIIANGLWTNPNGANQTITKRLDIPVSITEEPFDFALSADNNVLFLQKGKTTSVELTVNHLSGRPFPVTLSTVVAPLALETKLDNRTGIPDFTSELDIRALNAFSTRDLEVVASGGGKTHSIKIHLTNNPFGIELDSSSVIPAGGSADISVSIIPLVRGYNSTVDLSVSSSQLPENLSDVSLTSTQGIPPFSSVLRILTDVDIVDGPYSIEVTGTDGQFTTHATYTANVTRASGSGNRIQIDLEPRLDSLSIDGLLLPSNDLQVSPPWEVGEEHQLYALSEVSVNESTKYVFDGWSDGEKSPTRTIQVTELATSIVGKYHLQYYLAIDSAFGDREGDGWYDEGSMASFSVDKTVADGFGVNQIHDGWSGDSASLVGQLCQGGEEGEQGAGIVDDADLNRVNGVICMNAAHTLVANWKSDSSFRNAVIGGGLAAAIIGGVVATLAKTGSLTNLIKGKRPKIPILSWEVYSPAFLTDKGTVFVDVTLKNMGEADAKNIKIEASSEDLACPPAHLIETLMPWESRKIALVARPHESRPSYSMKVTLRSKYLPKKELMAVVAGTEIRYVPKKEASLSFPTRKIKVGVYGSGLNAKSGDLPGRLLERGFILENVGGSKSQHGLPSFEQMQASQYDVILLSSATELLEADVSSLKKFVTSGKGLVMLGAAVNDKSSSVVVAAASAGLHAGLFDLFGCKGVVPAGADYNKHLFIEFDRCLGVRIAESDHPVTRGFHGGEVFKTWGGPGAVLSLSPDSGGKVLAEQWLKTKDNQARNAASLPAMIAANPTHTTNSTIIEPTQETDGGGGGGRTVLLNIDSRLNITLELVERSLLWVSGAINDKSHSQD